LKIFLDSIIDATGFGFDESFNLGTYEHLLINRAFLANKFPFLNSLVYGNY